MQWFSFLGYISPSPGLKQKQQLPGQVYVGTASVSFECSSYTLTCLTACMMLPNENVHLRTNTEFRPGGSTLPATEVLPDPGWAAVFRVGQCLYL